MKRIYAYLLMVVLWCSIGASSNAGEKATAGGEESPFFRDQVKPILVRQCLGCHGPGKKKGDFDLSTRASLLEGGASGPAVMPGQAVNSLLFKKVATGKMPPQGPLPAQDIAVLKKWLDEGAIYGPKPLIASVPKQIQAPWSFQPLKKFSIPSSRFDHLAQNEVDRFLFAKIEEKKLAPSPRADKLALLRRVTFDMTGLPPTLEEVEAFLKDLSANAYEKVVDRLLASPAYGERWARHWLDVVRFGESHGYEQNHLRPNAWHYRDYVIRSLNEDKPYDRMITEQLAGDLLAKGDPEIEAATGFLVAGVHDTVGNSTEEGSRQQRANDLEDMVATTGAAFLGLTIQCAKCHDHKFDPIPQEDYYHLAAVFAGVRHGERPLGTKKTGSKNEGTRFQALERLRGLRGILDDLENAARIKVLSGQGVNPVPRPAVNSRRNVEDFKPILAKFIRFTIQATKDGAQPCLDELAIFGPDRKENLAHKSRGSKATASSLLPGYSIHQVAHLNDGQLGNDWSWISNESGKGWAQIELAKPAQVVRVVWSRDGQETPVFTDRLPSQYQVQISLDGQRWQTVADGRDRAQAREAITIAELRKAMTPEELKAHEESTRALEGLKNHFQASAGPAYVGQFTAPDPIHLLQRGDVMRRGPLVGPAALTRLPGLEGKFASEQVDTESGRRLALAKWITRSDNPLTARVLVNRIWQYHFGRGLVATSSDFGNNGTSPSHPELLDWLAQDFMDHGWKMKRLHKLLVMSHAYQQTSANGDQGLAIDADNQLLWRMPLRRLEGESLRDAILATSGKLDRNMGGPGYLLYKYHVVNVAIYSPLEEQGPATWRRAVYATSARAIREEMLANFDCPECAQRTPRRDSTTTPLQALSLLNGNFTSAQAKFFAERVAKIAGPQSPDQATLAFRLAMGRGPSARELAAASTLVERQGLAALCRALLNTNEFLYY